MYRLSFSHTLLLSFLLIAAILGSAALGGLAALESFVARSRAGADDALRATAAVQRLAERTVDLERSARQYLVLDDPVLLERFTQAHRESLSALARIDEFGLPHVGALIDGWRSASATAAVLLGERPDSEGPLTEALARLAPINEQLATAVRVQLGRNSQQLLEDLEAKRTALALHVAAAFVAAALLAALTGWWILRPVRGVEQAIDALGESRFDRPVVIAGPADLRKVGQRLDWLRQRLADLEASRTRVLRHVSHELKTPLASLREGIALLDDRVVGRLTGEQREVVSILESNARLLQQRIESLLDFNATVFDARRLSRRRVALRTLVDAVLAEQRLQMQMRGVHATVDGTVPPIVADPDKLKIVLSNLIANAVSFSPDGGEIRIALSARAGGVRIDCADDGPGVSAAEAERIFEPFFQGSRQASCARHGSGLGLSIVREFVLAHGGTVELLPDGPGAHFRVELPDEA